MAQVNRGTCCYPNKTGCVKYAPDVCNTRELTKLREDLCYLNRRNYDAKKPWKFITYQYRPYPPMTQCGGVVAPCTEGYLLWDGAVGSCTIGDESNLKIDDTMLTHAKFRQQMGNLRPNLPQVRGCLRPDIESMLIHSEYQDTKKNCKPTEVYLSNQYDPGLIALSWCPNNVENNVAINNGYRGGISTRNYLKENYLSGTSCYQNVNNWKQ